MECFLKAVLTNNEDVYSHRYFVRFGKGQYDRRFLISFDRGKAKIKIKTSFEFANDLVMFVKELGANVKFTGKILMKNKVPGKEGKKKAGVFLYEISDANIDDFSDAYFYLLDVNHPEIVLKTKKSLPKPGKDANKIDDKFCSLELDLKYWPKVKEMFFWDVPEGKKAIISHTLMINDIVFPKNEKDPVKIRELAKRKGKIIRKINLDGKDISNEHDFAA
jgi:hypothetical protein